jgi:hypothetical protein
MQSVSEWAALNFGNCELGDKRRTRRLVRLAEQVASHPAASLPDQTEHWKDLKAAYRLFDGEEVTFQAIARSHWELTRQAARGRCLVIGDTTELDFGRLRKIARIGETGNGSGQGFLLHNALLVQAQTAAIVGVAGQAIYYRRKNRTSHRRQNAAQRLARERESQVWNQVIDDIGPPAAGVEYVHVFDRGADSFEIYCHLLQSRSGWVIRAAKLNRYVLAGPQQRRMTLQNYLRQLKPLGRYTLQLRARPGQPARQALLEVRVGRVHIPRPRHVSSEIRRLKQQPIAMNVVEVVEIDPPGGATPIHWILFTSLPVGSFEEAWLVIEYYELRWLIEEYHKALKTGCRTESRQLQTADRLEAFVGLTSVVALRLLQLKSLARVAPEIPAQRVVPRVWLQMLKLARPHLSRVHDLTVGQFYRQVAMLGGFLGRTGDGDPGRITIWRGWEKLNTFVYAASKLKLTA